MPGFKTATPVTSGPPTSPRATVFRVSQAIVLALLSSNYFYCGPKSQERFDGGVTWRSTDKGGLPPPGRAVNALWAAQTVRCALHSQISTPPLLVYSLGSCSEPATCANFATGVTASRGSI